MLGEFKERNMVERAVKTKRQAKERKKKSGLVRLVYILGYKMLTTPPPPDLNPNVTLILTNPSSGNGNGKAYGQYYTKLLLC